MTDALFSDVLMFDRGPPASTGSARHATGPALFGQITPEELTGALAKALARVLPRDAATPVERGELAAAVADILAGRSAVLRVQSDVPDDQLAAVRMFLEKLVRVTGSLGASRQETAISRLAEILLPDDLADARGALAADNLELRDRLIAQTSPLTSAEVGARAGHRSSNPYATAARWKKAGDIFSVQHRGTEYFPAFQFRDGRPHPTVKKVLAALPEGPSPWQVALWFVSANGWLDDRAPADLLDDPGAVVAAAKREGQEVIG